MVSTIWTDSADAGEIVRQLTAHRLAPVASLLVDRGLVRGDLLPIMQQMSARHGREMHDRIRVEDEVMLAIADSGFRCLVHKGAAVGRLVYPQSWQRLRLDLDLAVVDADVPAVGDVLRRLGFKPRYDVTGGPPILQTQWVRVGDAVPHSIDLHSGLFNEPVLKGRLHFEMLWSRSRPAAGLDGSVRFPDHRDLLLHACAHYFGHHRGEFRPDQWLLDVDLLWRGIDSDEKNGVGERALATGIGSLLAAGLRRARERFGTPVDPEWLQGLESAAGSERAKRLIAPPGSRFRELMRSAMDERNWRARIAYLRATALPPAAHMRWKYPDAPGWALPWLYVRRMLNSGRRGPK